MPKISVKLEDLRPINTVVMMQDIAVPLLWVSSLPNLRKVRESLAQGRGVYLFGHST